MEQREDCAKRNCAEPEANIGDFFQQWIILCRDFTRRAIKLYKAMLLAHCEDDSRPLGKRMRKLTNDLVNARDPRGAMENANVTLQRRYKLGGGFRVCYQLPFYDYLAALLPLDPPLSG